MAFIYQLDSNIQNYTGNFQGPHTKMLHFTNFRPYRNLIHALATGAVDAVKLCASVAVNLIAFISALALVNATLGWAGHRVGVNSLTFQVIQFKGSLIIM